MQAFKYGAMIGAGLSLVRYGVSGLVDTIEDSLTCCPSPPPVAMRARKRKRKIIESDSESSEEESKEPPRKRAKFNEQVAWRLGDDGKWERIHVPGIWEVAQQDIKEQATHADMITAHNTQNEEWLTKQLSGFDADKVSLDTLNVTSVGNIACLALHAPEMFKPLAKEHLTTLCQRIVKSGHRKPQPKRANFKLATEQAVNQQLSDETEKVLESIL
jgi:hypothetical protein